MKKRMILACLCIFFIFCGMFSTVAFAEDFGATELMEINEEEIEDYIDETSEDLTSEDLSTEDEIYASEIEEYNFLSTSSWDRDTDGMTSDQIYQAIWPCGEDLYYHLEDINGGAATYSSTGYKLCITGDGTDMWDVEDGYSYSKFLGYEKVKEIDFSGAPNLKYLGSKVFRNMNSLEEVSIPSSVESMGTYILSLCDNLKTVSMPCSVLKIPDGMCFSCKKLKEFEVDIVLGGYKTNEIGNSAFFDCEELDRFSYREISPADGVIKLAGISTVGASAFSKCLSIEKAYIPATITKIGISMFKDCTMLSYVEAEDGVLEILGNAFQGCTSLKSMNANEEIVLPKTLTSMKGSCFRGCTSIKRVTYPASYSNENSAQNFGDCTALYRVDYENGAKTVALSNFNGCSALSDIYIYGNPSCSDYYSNLNPSSITIHAYDNSIAKERYVDGLGMKYDSLGTKYPVTSNPGGNSGGSSGKGEGVPTSNTEWLEGVKISDTNIVLNLATKEKYTLSDLKKEKADGKNYKISYSSKEDARYAAMSSTGLVTAKKEGKSVITVIKGDKTYNVTVNVYDPKFTYTNPKQNFLP